MNTVYATYEDISDCWPIFKHNIDGFFPLRNVYKPRIAGAFEMNTLIRTIPIINVKFIPMKAEILTERSILNRHERPYLNIFIGFCEDIDVYRQRFRPKLKSWLETVSIKKNHQYFVILIENQTKIHELNKSGSAFLLDKIRFDFSDKVALKLISLKVMPGENLNSIPECVDIISDCIYYSALMNLNQLDEDIKKMAETRNMAGWNYCNFFLTKESKALSLNDLGLFSEAIACYDELETLFSELQTSSIPDKDNFTTFCFELILPSDSAISGSDLNSLNWPRYRELIHQNRISLYEFHIYLFSRQLYTLIEMKSYDEILKRCKELVCNFSFIEDFNSLNRKRWIYETVFFVLKVSESGLTQSDLSTDISNLLVDCLALANDQINLEAIHRENENELDQILDLSQIINLFAELTIETHLYFKISILKYCLSILKSSKSNHKRLMLRLKLSDLYYKAEAFNLALDILQDEHDQKYIHSWPKIQQKLLEKSCDCYWSLNMPREYLRKSFDIFRISGNKILLDDAENHRIENSINLLDDILCLDFATFLKINELTVNHSTSGEIVLQLVLDSTINLSLLNCEISVTLSGEKNDITSYTSSLKQNTESLSFFDLSFKKECIFGAHKLKNISVRLGKLVFESKNIANLWDRDINIIASEGLIIEGIVPDNFDFNDPSIIIRFRNNLSSGITKIYVSITLLSDIIISPVPSPDIKIAESGDKLNLDYTIDSNSSTDIKFYISKYYPGLQSVKIDSSFILDGVKKHTSQRIELNLPKPWKIEQFSFAERSLNLNCLKIIPDFNPGVSFETIEILSDEYLKKIEIERNSELHMILRNSDSTHNLKILYRFSKEDKLKSVSIKSFESDFNMICCKLLTRMNHHEINVGSLLTFDVHLEGCADFSNIPYSLVYDQTKWLLSGPCNGLSKENWSFGMVPLCPGFLQLPSLLFSTSIPIHYFTDGAGIIINV